MSAFYDLLLAKKLSGGGSPGPGPSPSSDDWTRPSTWPDLDSLDLTDFEGVYLTYDLTEFGADPHIALNVRTQDNADFNVDRGHISNGAFVVDESFTGQSHTSDSMTQRFRFNEALDPANGNVQLFRVTTTTSFLWIYFTGDDVHPGVDQPCVERYGRLSNVTKIDTWYNSGSYKTYQCYSWSTRWLQHDKVVGVGASNLITTMDYTYSFSNSLEKVELDGWQMGGCALTTLGNAFSNCSMLKTVDMSAWDTSSWVLRNISSTFMYCANLRELKWPSVVNLAAASFSTNNAFQFCGLKSVDFRGFTFDRITQWTGNPFQQNASFETILGLENIPAAAILTNWNNCPNPSYCYGLKNYKGIHCAANYQTYSNNQALSAESLAAILANLEEPAGTGYNISLPTNQKARLTAAQIAVATDKGWTVN